MVKWDSHKKAKLHDCLDAADSRDASLLEHHLTTVKASVDSMYVSLRKMTDWCDPHVYYQRVRPYLNGWKGNAALPVGLIYQGVDAYEGTPQQFRGPTGAQSATLPSLDAMLGIGHQEHAFGNYLIEMRTYMPPRHRAFIESVEARGPVRPFVERCGQRALTELYNASVDGVERFRTLHLQYAASYIFRQGQIGAGNPHALGTGGTPFMNDLKEQRDRTALQRIK